MKSLDDANNTTLSQFIKFGIVGISNTIISYCLDMLCYYVIFKDILLEETVKVFISTLIAFIVSVSNSYYWNNKYVFVSGKRHGFLKHFLAYLKTIVSYGLTGLVLAPLIKLYIGKMGLAYWLAGFSSLLVTVPLNFLLNKFWSFKE